MSTRKKLPRVPDGGFTRVCCKPTTHYELVGRKTRNGNRVFVSREPGPGVRFVRADRPCGVCIACRVSRRIDWALRLSHEAQTSSAAWFFTLTYDDAHLPYGSTLVREHCQKFVRALRKRVETRVRYFITGEYGGQRSRPHYHGILFGPSFPDKRFLYDREGNSFFASQSLSDAWGRGLAEFSQVSPATMMYVTKYHVDKVVGDRAAEHYAWFVPETGEVVEREREFALMSSKPGIGAEWFDRYWSDCYPSGFLVSKGVKYRPPAYYDSLLKRSDPELYESVKADREANLVTLENRLMSRREAREVVALARSGLEMRRL